MIIEFDDETTLDVIRIFGKPEFIMGEVRDVLKFEFDANTHTIEGLTEIFTNKNKVDTIYSHIVDGEDEHVYPIAEDYYIFIECVSETRPIPVQPGLMRRPDLESIISVKIAQLTWDEYDYNYRHNTLDVIKVSDAGR